MKKTINKVHVEGRVYDFDLAEKTVQNPASKFYGKEFIGGTIDIATDNAGLNVIQVAFPFVQPTTSTGKQSPTYTALKKIIDSGKTVLQDGMENATMVKVDSSLALNDFYTERGNEEVLVSAKRIQGGFINIVNSLNEVEAARNTFECDILINGTQIVEANPEKNIENDYLVIKGAVFDFRNAILPTDFVVKNPAGMKFFESRDVAPTNLLFTKIWGTIKSETIVTRREEESAFGDPSVKEFTKVLKEWIVNGTSSEEKIYELGNASTGITEEEIKKAMTDRETYLAEVKKKADDYKAQKAAGNAASNVGNVATAAAVAGGFNF